MKNVLERLNEFKMGDVVIHFKKELYKGLDPEYYLYEIIGPSTNTETGEKVMVYRLLYEPNDENCPYHKGDLVSRPLDMFLSEVDNRKYPFVSQKYRFEKINTGKKYRSKPHDIEALQWTGLNLRELKNFCGNDAEIDIIDTAWEVGKGAPVVLIRTPIIKSAIRLNKNDYVIRYCLGVCPCKEEEFLQKYEEIPCER